MPTSYKDIAKVAGVSVAAVQRALNGDNKETWASTRKRADRIRKVAEELGYRKNLAAKAMRSKRFGQVGVLLKDSSIADILDETLYEIMLGIEAGLEKADTSMVMVRFNENLTFEPRPFRENMLDGLIALGELPDEVTARAESRIKNLIWVEGARWDENNCIRRDEVSTGRMALEGLVKAGRKKFYYIGNTSSKNPNVHYSVIERFEGIENAAEDAGVKVEKLEFDSQTFDQAFEELLPLGPEVGIAVYNQHMAERILTLANRHGLQVGKDFGLTSCDSLHRFESSWPELSRVKLYRFNLGLMAAEMILNLIEKGEETPSRRYPAKWHAGGTA